MQFFLRNGRWLTREQVKEYNAKKRMPEYSSPEPVDGLQEKVGQPEMKFFELKKLAKEKGMEITNKTKKEEITSYLSNL